MKEHERARRIYIYIINYNGECMMKRSAYGKVRRILTAVLLLALVFSLCAPSAEAAYKLGERGDGVLRVKKELKSAGYYSGSLNKTFDKALRDAVTVFQRANAIDETGELTDVTLKYIQDKSYITYKQYEQKLKDQMLKPGGKGKYVSELTKRLIALKYLSGKPVDAYGTEVTGAVKLFQSYNGLKQTGIADQETRNLLNSKKAVSKTKYESEITKPLKKGNKGEAVRTLQTQLSKLGYYQGPTTGNYDNTVVKAVSSFQTANGIKATGTACRKTRTLLNSGKGVDKATYDESLKTKALKPKDTGEAVKLLQKRLAELGYYGKTINGKYDTATKDAVAKFQKYNKLTSDGVASEQTRKAMNATSAVKVSDVEGPKSIKKGSTGDQVKSAQARLKELGFFTGSVNGKYQSDTESAVKAFQEANGLKKTGALSGSDQLLLLSNKAVSKSTYLEDQRKKRAERVIAAAMGQLGKPYVWGTSGPNSFDCTGLTCYAYGLEGIKLKRSAYEQGYKNGKRIEKLKDVRRGDIVVFNTVDNGPDNLSSHVGIYLGDGQFIHASSAGGKVIISTLSSGYYNRVFSWGLNVW